MDKKTDWTLLFMIIPIVCWQFLLIYYSSSLSKDFIEFSPNSKFIGIAESFYFGMIAIFVVTAALGYFIVKNKFQGNTKFLILAGVLVVTVCVTVIAIYIGYGPIFELESK